MSHVLKPMMETAIKVDIFPAVMKKNKDPLMDTPKPRMALFQGEENDVVVSGLKIPATSFETTCKDSNDCTMKVGSIDVILNENNGNILSDVLLRTYMFVGGKFKADHQTTAAVHKRKLINTLSKPRTALIQGTVDDEPKATNIVSSIECQEKYNDLRSVAGNLSQYPIQFGTFSIDRKYYKEYEKLDCELMEMRRRPASIGGGLQTCPNCRIYMGELAHKSNSEFRRSGP
jgi:hypothetical protein